MRKLALGAGVLMGLVGCATTPVASEKLVDSKVAIRSARDSGAEQIPAAARHLKLAEEQNRLAEKELEDGNTEEAAHALMRAEADANLAVALAKEAPTRRDAERARERIQALQKQTQ